MKIIVVLLVLSFFAVAPSVGAQQQLGNFRGPSTISGLPTPITQTTDVESLSYAILDWIFWGLIVFAVAMFLVGGYRYATSGGDPEKVRSANKTLLYAVIAVAVALVANGIPLLISSFFNV